MSRPLPDRPDVRLRPYVAMDLPFLQALYDSTRAAEMAFAPWPDEQKHAFLRQQLTARETHYRGTYPGARHEVVLVDGTHAGRLMVAADDQHVLVVDIALLPRFRGQGLGAGLLRQVVDDADGRPVRLHVDPLNPARRLYVRLGFTSIGVDGVYELMERVP